MVLAAMLQQQKQQQQQQTLMLHDCALHSAESIKLEYLLLFNSYMFLPRPVVDSTACQHRCQIPVPRTPPAAGIEGILAREKVINSLEGSPWSSGE